MPEQSLLSLERRLITDTLGFVFISRYEAGLITLQRSKEVGLNQITEEARWQVL